MSGVFNHAQQQHVGSSSVHRPDVASTFRDINVVVSECRNRKWEVEPNEVKYLEEIGNGSNGVVFKAEYKGRLCVAKRAIPFWTASEAKNANKDMVAELDILMSVGKHPNVVEMVGASTANPEKIFVMEEYVDGPTLEQYFRDKWISNGPGFTPKWKVGHSWIMGIMQALEFLHERDPVIMHRDLKPANLLLTKDLAIIKLCDFGLSKKVTKKEKDQTVHSGRMGTQRFMAPEVRAERHGIYNEKADVFSAGQVMWLILYGRQPHPITNETREVTTAPGRAARTTSTVSRSTSEMSGDDAEGEVARVHPLDPPACLVELMARCRAKEARERPSAREGVAELKTMAGTLGQGGCCALQ